MSDTRCGKKLYVLFVILTLGAITGCISFQTGANLDVTDSGPPLQMESLKGKRLWVRSFGHSAVTGVTTAYVVGSGGHSASGIAVSRGKFTDAPPTLLRALEENGVFKSVTPTMEIGSKPDLILEGNVSTNSHTPWWTWVQWIDLLIHAYIFPTLGRDWVTEGEMALYDQEHALLHRWKFKKEDSYISTIWWGIGHGGAGDTGFDVELQNEALSEITKRVNANMTTSR